MENILIDNYGYPFISNLKYAQDIKNLQKGLWCD